MKVLVLSDTHIPERARDLPQRLYQELESASFIIHAGDFTEWWVVEKLRSFAPLKAVRGNMDTQEVREQLPEREIFDLGGVRVGLIHGWGSPAETRRRIKEAFHKANLQLLVYGHTHQPQIEKIDDVLWVNPGSPTDSVFAPFFSFAYLEIEAGTIQKVELVRIP